MPLVPVVAFDDVALRVISVAWIALAILIAALLASAIERVLVAIDRADAIVFEAALGLEPTIARSFYQLYRSRGPRNVAVAWILSVIAGPIGAYGYLGHWGKFTAAVVTLNGLGAWWIECWFSIPQIVLLENARSAGSNNYRSRSRSNGTERASMHDVWWLVAAVGVTAFWGIVGFVGLALTERGKR